MSFTSSKLSPLWNGFMHGAAGFIVYAVPLFMMQHQALGAVTVSSIVIWGLKWIDGKLGSH